MVLIFAVDGMQYVIFVYIVNGFQRRMSSPIYRRRFLLKCECKIKIWLVLAQAARISGLFLVNRVYFYVYCIRDRDVQAHTNWCGSSRVRRVQCQWHHLP